MAYTPQPGAPQFTVDGRTFTLTTAKLEGLVSVYRVILLEKSGGNWVSNQPAVFDVADNGEGSLMAVVTQYGGVAALCAQIKTNIRNLLAKMFPASAPPAGDPTNDAAVWAALQAFVASLSVDTSTRPPTVS